MEKIAPAQDFQLWVFMASVIKTSNRLSDLKKLLKSVSQQKTTPDLFVVSIFLHPHLGGSERIEKLFKDFSDNLVLIVQKEVKKQFVQFRELLEHLQERPDCSKAWIVFTDDDDLWHPERLYDFSRCIKTLFYNDMQDLFFSIFHPQLTTIAKTECCSIDDPTSVEKAIKCGCVKHFCFEKSDIPQNLEYVSFCVRFGVVRKFMKESTYFVDTNRYCDMYFMCWIRDYKNESQKMLMSSTKKWMYFYKKTSKTYRQFDKGILDEMAKITAEMMQISCMYLIGSSMRCAQTKEVIEHRGIEEAIDFNFKCALEDIIIEDLKKKY